jgi:hypothetical protein
VKSGPEVSFVGMAFALSRARKRLTRTGARPDGALVGPSCQPQRVGPSADSGEEMALGVSGKVTCLDIDDASFVNVAIRDKSCDDKVPEPSRGIRFNLVVVSRHYAYR